MEHTDELRVVTRKVPGGKLVRLKALVQDGRMTRPQLSGDFFLDPSEKVVALEDALEGFPVQDADDLAEVLQYVVHREGITLTGVHVEDIVAIVKELQ